MTVPSLIHEMDYVLETRDPLPVTEGAPLGPRQYWHLAEATLKGSRISASLATPGIDWLRVGDDGFWRPDCRLQFVTDDDAVIFLEYGGLVEQTPKFVSAAENDRETDWDDQYLRMHLTFDTGHPSYKWLTQSLFVARGRLLGTGRLFYEVYRLS